MALHTRTWWSCDNADCDEESDDVYKDKWKAIGIADEVSCDDTPIGFNEKLVCSRVCQVMALINQVYPAKQFSVKYEGSDGNLTIKISGA